MCYGKDVSTARGFDFGRTSANVFPVVLGEEKKSLVVPSLARDAGRDDPAHSTTTENR